MLCMSESKLTQITQETAASNNKRKEEGKPLAGGESSADYSIGESDGSEKE